MRSETDQWSELPGHTSVFAADRIYCNSQEAGSLDATRFAGIVRPYGRADVMRLRGTVRIEHSLARMGAERLWDLMHNEPYVPALGALTGNQAVAQVQAGLKAIYLSGWQVA